MVLDIPREVLSCKSRVVGLQGAHSAHTLDLDDSEFGVLPGIPAALPILPDLQLPNQIGEAVGHPCQCQQNLAYEQNGHPVQPITISMAAGVEDKIFATNATNADSPPAAPLSLSALPPLRRRGRF